MVVADLHKAFIYAIADSLSVKHLLMWEILIGQGLNDAGVYGDLVIEEIIVYIGDEVKFT